MLNRPEKSISKGLQKSRPMDITANNQSGNKDGANKTSDSSTLEPDPDLGPNFDPLDDKQRRKLILEYAWKHHRLQITFMGIILLGLFIGVLIWDELSMPIFQGNETMASSSPSGWIDWLINAQSILGVGTLLVAIFVWWGEISEDWRNDLPKKLSVFFFYGCRPVIVCRYVWLAGADELRIWGQQVAKQAAGNQLLDFGPDVEAKKPVLVSGLEGEVFVHYSVCFKLTNLNQYLKDHSAKCIYQNMASKNKEPKDIKFEDVEGLRVVTEWKIKKDAP